MYIHVCSVCVCVCVCAYILREERDNILRGLPQVSGDMLFSHNFDVGQVLDFFKLRVSRYIHVLTARLLSSSNILFQDCSI